ncbi:MAG: hypothetical protein ABIE74_10905 [Pseudomonadota bacterium]
MTTSCDKFIKPKNIDSSRSAYEWWLKRSLNIETPVADVGSNGLNISIFQDATLLTRFKRKISKNPLLLRHFNQKVLGFVNDFRNDLNKDGNKNIITKSEVSALAKDIKSQNAGDVIVDLSAVIYLIKNINRIDSRRLQKASTMREAYLAFHYSGKKLVPDSVSRQSYNPKMIGCFLGMTKSNPKLTRNWRRVERCVLNGTERASFHALFKALQPKIKKPPVIKQIKKTLPKTKTKKVSWGRRSFGLVLAFLALPLAIPLIIYKLFK